MSKYTAKDLETLRKQAQEIEKVLAAQNKAREDAYTAQQTALQQKRESALRQAYIGQQQALAQLPEQLATAGINGGAAESSLVRLNRAYGSKRADIGGQYAKASGELQVQQAAAAADAAAQTAQNRIDYLGAESALQAELQAQAQRQAALQNSTALEQRLTALQREVETLRGTATAQTGTDPEKKKEKTGYTKPAGSNSQLVGHTELIR